MTNGNTAPLYVLGGTQNDYFEVDHNVGLLYLAGDAGDDTFLINTFLAAQAEPGPARRGHEPDDALRRHRLQPLRVRAERAGRDQRRLAASTRSSSSARRSTTRSSSPTTTSPAPAASSPSRTSRRSRSTAAAATTSIWVLSTNPALTVTVNGGTGDDTIHIGGTPPPLVYAPPPYTYTPPPYTVTKTQPRRRHDDHPVLRLLGRRRPPLGWGFWRLAVARHLRQHERRHRNARQQSSSASRGRSPSTAIFSVASPGDLVLRASSAVRPRRRPQRQSRGSRSQLVPDTSVIQPPSVTVTPAPVIIAAPPSVDASQVKSKLVVIGGDDFETNGDTVVYENSNSTVGRDRPARAAHRCRG